MQLLKFHLPDEYRLVLDDLQGQKFYDKIFENYSVEEISQIITYYEIDVKNKYFLNCAKKNFVDNSKPYSAFKFAEKILKGRWRAGERAILKNSTATYFYVRTVLKKRWIESESVLAQDPVYAYWYASAVLKSRFKTAEYKIFEDPVMLVSYAKLIKNTVKDDKLLKQIRKVLLKYFSNSKNLNVCRLINDFLNEGCEDIRYNL